MGLDVWKYEGSVRNLLRMCSKQNIGVYEVTQYQQYVIFYASFFQKKEIVRTLQDVAYIKTTGCLGLLIKMLSTPRHLISIIISIILWYGLSHIIFSIEFIGEKTNQKNLLQTALFEMQIETPFFEKDIGELKTELKKRTESSIAWLEFVKEGSRYKIYYTPKEFVDIKELSRDELIAQKDGVIASFDVQHGNKNCKLNDFVHQGDVLVRNILTDSMNIDEEIYVKGKVFAYTWQDITVSMEDSDFPEAFEFYQLLLEARSEVSKELTKRDEKIYKENILHFTTDMGTISMTIHYTLYEDITSPT